MLTNSSLQPLLAQFQARYPTASLISELLTIHQDNYVVRAIVQIGNTPIATGMAAENNVEQAEDRAKLRVLAALGIESFMAGGTTTPPSSAHADYSSLPLPPHLTSQTTHNFSSSKISDINPLPDLPLADLPSTLVEDKASTHPIASPVQQPDLAIDIPALDQSTLLGTSYTSSMEDGEALIQSLLSDPLDYSSPPLSSAPSNSALPDPVEINPEPSPANPSAPPGTKKSTKRKTEASETSEPDAKGSEKTNENNDRSEEIARIGVEMKRLGWTTEQGRSYLKRTYGKKSRQELSDDELLDFLRYLESQASPTSSLF